MNRAAQAYLNATELLPADNPDIQQWAEQAVDQQAEKLTQAVQLYYAVRDHWIYDPYHLDISRNGLQATNLLYKRRAWCVEKAAFYVACARSLNIPARPGYAIVVNHIGTERLAEILRREEIVFHGYADVYLEGQWVKCTPAFDKKICRLSGVQPLDFDGSSDSLFHPYEGDQKFMEYVHDYGTFENIPVQKMNEEMKKYYPHLFDPAYEHAQFDFVFE